MGKPLIVIVDDEEGIVRLCERLLKRAGFGAIAFTEPEKAMAYLREARADLLLVDIRMPKVDGFEVITGAKAYHPDLATLVMTGFGTVETAIKALRQGVDGVILKPFEQGDELVGAVKQALADNQRKRDAAHTEALRPLFDVTETFLSETRPSRLPELIVEAVISHLRCANAAYWQDLTGDARELVLLFKRGQAQIVDDAGDDEGWLKSVYKEKVPVRVAESDLSLLQENKIGSALLVPMEHFGVHGLLYAGRGSGETPFRDIDLDTLVILARQAAVALENARLYAELRAYIQQVEDSQKALLQAEKMAAAGRLTASIAHEVNNPLQAVRNCLHLAGRDDLSEDKQAEYFTLAQTELERLTNTVQRMLDFYRPGKVTPQNVDIADTLEHVLRLMRSQFQKNNVVVKTFFADDLPPVKAVGAQLQQVFMNLALNAYDAMPNGGVLEIKASRNGDSLEIFFQDDGLGVPPERRESIFDPFVSSKQNGTGLGLTVSYNIISAVGGELKYIQTDRQGACFHVSLPLGGAA